MSHQLKVNFSQNSSAVQIVFACSKKETLSHSVSKEKLAIFHASKTFFLESEQQIILSLQETTRYERAFGAQGHWFQLGGNLGKLLVSHSIPAIQVSWSSFESWAKKMKINAQDCFVSFFEGLALSLYSVEKIAQKKEDKVKTITLSIDGGASIKKMIFDSEVRVEFTSLARSFGNLPSNIGTPHYYASTLKALAKKYGVKCTLISEKEAEKKGLGLLTGVSRGSQKDAWIVILDYAPKKYKKTVGLIGKGITFDTGGISIKPSKGMEEMKFDMCGAANSACATLLAARLKSPNRVVGIVGFAENCPGSLATHPGDIHTSAQGLTVEVQNTDAEGRLLLADLFHIMKTYKPDVCVNMATLTGAVGIALGKFATGIMGNDETLIDTLMQLGLKNAERMWRLPIFEDSREELKSDYADLKNISASGLAGTIQGASFLSYFIDSSWAHLDVAYTAWDMGHHSFQPKKGATGVMVRTLAQFALEY